MSRPIGVTLLAIGAGVAGLLEIWRMLVFLARRPGDFVSKEELAFELWPSECWPKTRVPREPVRIDRRLRQLKSDLIGAFRRLGADQPLEQRSGRAGGDGAFRLALTPDQVMWVTDGQ